MKQIFILIFLLAGTIFVNAQEKPVVSPSLQDARSKMVLRGNTRDHVYVMKNNTRQQQLMKRRQVAIKRQHIMVKRRIQQNQRRKIMQKRNIQQRRMRQQAVRRQQMQKR